jgi:hypothetical protein
MSNITLTSNSKLQNLTVPKLCDDRSNWADYEPQVTITIQVKGIWKHVQGTAYEFKLYAVVNNIHVLSDGRTQATEEQIMECEEKIDEYECKENTVQHVILSTMSICLGVKIKNLKSAKELWEKVKKDATIKSTLFLIDAEDELASMKCQEVTNAKTHLAEITAHFNLMIQHKENLIKMGLSISDTRFNMPSPTSYCPTKQTIAATERTIKSSMSSTDLITFFTEDAQNHYIEEQQAGQAESALYAHKSKQKKSKGYKQRKSGEKCDNCGKDRHTVLTCYQKGGGKEGQTPWRKKGKKDNNKGEKKTEETMNTVQEKNSSCLPIHLNSLMLQKLFRSRN